MKLGLRTPRPPGRGRADSVEEGTLAKPISVAPVPLRRAERHREVSARQDAASPAEEERGRYYGSKTRDCAGCALRVNPKARSSKEVLIPHAYPALLRARRRHARWGEEERRIGGAMLGGLPRRRRRTCTRGASRPGKIQSYLTAAAVIKRLSAALAARLFEGPGPPGKSLCASISPSQAAPASCRRRVTFHTAHSQNRVIQQPLEGE